MTITGGRVELEVPEGWTRLTGDLLPQEWRSGGVEMVCAGQEAVDSFTPTLVLLSSAEIPDPVGEWIGRSMELLAKDVPGFLVIDDQGWERNDWIGSYRCGTYILEASSVTVVQWACAGKSTVATLTASCATRVFETLLPIFVAAAASLAEV